MTQTLERLPGLVEELNDFERYQTYEEIRASMRAIVASVPVDADGNSHMHIEEIGRASDRSAEYPDGRPIEAIFASTPGTENTRPWVILEMEHENELPPTLAMLLVAKVIAKHPEILDELGLNLVIIPATHPDGIALQRWAWEGGEFNPLKYLQGLFRSAPAEQITWGFPFQYEHMGFNNPSAENLAIMALRRRLKARSMHSLHGNVVGDAFTIGTSNDEAFFKAYRRVVELYGFRMQAVPEDEIFVRHNDAYPGMYKPVTVRDSIHASFPGQPVREMSWEGFGGDSSYGFMASEVAEPEYLATEFPYMDAPDAHDHTTTNITAAEATQEMLEFTGLLIEMTRNKLKLLRPAVANSNSPEVARLVRSLEWWIPYKQRQLAASRTRQHEAGSSRMLTKAEYFSKVIWKLYDTGLAGQVGSLARELGNAKVQAEVAGEVEQRWTAFKEKHELIPYELKKIVGAQALGSLVALVHSKERPQNQQA